MKNAVTAAVLAAATMVAQAATVGVTVNGVDVGNGSGAGWGYSGVTLTLNQPSATYVVAGSSTAVSLFAAANCTVIASNLTLNVSSRSGVPAFNCGTNAVTLQLWNDGTAVNTFKSGANRAGIQVVSNAAGCASLTITNLNESGALTVTGGNHAAGIGGGEYGAGGVVTINGGTIKATAGSWGAGIGGGYSGSGLNGGGIITIRGGHVTASAGGGQGGAGIGAGGSDGSAGTDAGTILISGGTIRATATGGYQGSHDIGSSSPIAKLGSVTFTGGSVWCAASSTGPVASNGTASVYSVTVPGLTANGPVSFSDLPDGFGANDIVADASGNAYLWLPAGSYAFTANGTSYTASVGTMPTIAFYEGLQIGLTVNGIDAGAASGSGWSYDGTYLTLAEAGPYVISGSNSSKCPVGIQAAADCTVIASNLIVDVAASPGLAALDCGTNAVTLQLWNDGTAKNTLKGGYNRAAISVVSNAAGCASLTITNFNVTGSLVVAGGLSASGIGCGTGDAGNGPVSVLGGIVTAQGGTYGAGIGGGSGAVTVVGGTVKATGGARGAGIGGNSSRPGCVVLISGGAVTATGTAGIGGGSSGAGGVVTISGGTVTATGGSHGAGIGGCDKVGGVVTISGGKVTANTSDWAAGIGGGYTAGGGTITISGGQVTATGKNDASGIGAGGGPSPAAGTIRISGGTVRATKGSSGSADIGASKTPATSGSVTFTGGSVWCSVGSTRPAASNDTKRVYCVTVPGLTPDEPVVFSGLPDGFGTDDIFADASGKAYLWLPNKKNYWFFANGESYYAQVADAATTAEQRERPGTIVLVR